MAWEEESGFHYTERCKNCENYDRVKEICWAKLDWLRLNNDKKAYGILEFMAGVDSDGICKFYK